MTLYCFQLCRVLRCLLSTSNLGARRDIMLLMWICSTWAGVGMIVDVLFAVLHSLMGDLQWN